MTVARVFTQTHICDYEEGWELSTDELYGLDHRTLRVVGSCAQGIFGSGCERHTEEDDTSETFGHKRLKEGDELIQAEAVLVGEGRDRSNLVRVVGDEERVDEHRLERVVSMFEI